jgi:acyl-CoA synthetase (AMP-forming)/AMP-acid ligase II
VVDEQILEKSTGNGIAADSNDRVRLWEAFDDSPRGGCQLIAWDGSSFEQLTWDQWRAGAQRAAAGLRARGVRDGALVGCLLTNSAAASRGLLGVWWAGGAAVSLPTPARGMSWDLYAAQLRRICESAQVEVLLVDDTFVTTLASAELGDTSVVGFAANERGGVALDPAPPAATELAFVQYSSGSTSEPRGCALTAGAIDRQLAMAAERLEVDGERDRILSWLPLSHDFGVFGCLLLSVWTGTPLTLSTPERFLGSPRTWFEDCAREQATMTAAPNFALELAARAARVKPPGHCPMRTCVLGGERIEADTIARAISALGPSGLTTESLVPAYGMAEVVLGVTTSSHDRPPAILELDPAALRDNRLAPPQPAVPSTRLVSNGPMLAGVSVEVSGGAPVGELLVRSPCLMSGYLGDERATADRVRDGALHTRDVGFLQDGEVYVVGRTDDVMIVGGRNVWARDLERHVERVPGVRTGCCVVVDVADDHGSRLVVLAEPARGHSDHLTLARATVDAATQAGGVAISEGLIVAPGTLPKTPSGKLQRHRCRDLVSSVDALARA